MDKNTNSAELSVCSSIKEYISEMEKELSSFEWTEDNKQKAVEELSTLHHLVSTHYVEGGLSKFIFEHTIVYGLTTRTVTLLKRALLQVGSLPSDDCSKEEILE